MSTPNWASILEILYNKSSYDLTTDIDSDHPFVSETKLDSEEVNVAISRLRNWELVTTVHVPGSGSEDELSDQDTALQLTEKGFNIAHDRNLSDRNDRINASLVIFTLFLVLINLLDFAPLKPVWRLLISLGFMIVLLALVIWTEIIDFDVLG
jgi:hypothetical protein